MDDEIKIEPEVDAEGGDPEEAADEGEKENKIAKMREELSACRKDKQEYMDGWQRAKADYVNLLKRIETDTKTAEFKGKVKAVETLLPAFDALERAKEHGDPSTSSGQGFPEGFLAIAKQIEGAFAALGLEEVGKLGEGFDPTIHDALGQDIVDNPETDHTVTAVLEKGWRVGESVIRPAKVRVGHFG